MEENSTNTTPCVTCSDSKCLTNYLTFLYGDIYKLLPMKEEELLGLLYTVPDYMESLLIVIIGALQLYPALKSEKKYLYVLNNMEYLRHNYKDIDFTKWRKIILKSTRNIGELSSTYGR